MRVKGIESHYRHYRPEGRVFDHRYNIDSEIFRRIAYLGLLRELQVNRWTDVTTLRKRLQVSQANLYTITGLITIMARAEGLKGLPKGIDPEVGHPYKLWEVLDIEAIRAICRKYHLPLMPPSGKQRISGVDEAHRQNQMAL